MSELKAWREIDMTALERELLAAARADRMPAELGLRVSSALTTSVSAGGSSGVAAQGGLWFVKNVWGVLSIVLLAGAGAFYASTSAPAVIARPQPAISLPKTVPEPATSVAPPAAAAQPIEAPRAAQPTALLDEGALRREVSLLDRARVALDRGAAVAALALLEQHRTRFARGALAPEAEALRIEALAQRGDVDEARARLQRFMRAHQSHPMSERLRALSGEN
jgi:hypothetical protein